MGKRQSSLLQGTLDVLILKALATEELHGYGVSRWIQARTDGAFVVEDAALYQALHRMEDRGWLESEWGLSESNRRAKYYRPTAKGRKQLARESATWREYADAVLKVLGEA